MAHKNNVAVMIDVGAKFFDSVVFRGWLGSASSPLQSMTLRLEDHALASGQVIESYAGVPATREYRGWQVQALLPPGSDPLHLELVFELENGTRVNFSASELLNEKQSANTASLLVSQFFTTLEKKDFTRILDLGGRDRSEKGIWLYQPRHEVTVFDIIDAPGVNVVGDAHHVSEHFPAGHFDAIFCNAVMEHIAMPWRVATEVAKVLRMGGVGLFHTHQTLGMHDRPWDFWRYSDVAWDAIFNKHTGFEIIDRTLAGEMFIIPFAWRPGIEFEKAAGYESSCVMVRKIAEPSVEWPVKLADIIQNMYPKS